MSVNLVILVGNLTRDAEVRQVGQSQVAKFGLATSERYRKADGTTAEVTEFHNVELWGAAGVYPYLVKGQCVYVQGTIRTDRYTGQDGQERTAVKIKAQSVQLVGARPQQQAAPQEFQQTQTAPPQFRQGGFAPAPQGYGAPVPPTPPTPPVPPAPSAPQMPQYAQQAGQEYAQQFVGLYDDLPQ